MKKELKGFICGALTATIIGGATFAASQYVSIDVLQNDISVVVDGNPLTEDNFVYNDRTYLPLRAVAEAVGKPVEYDEETNTAYIGKKPEIIETVIDNTVIAKVGNTEITKDDIKYNVYIAVCDYSNEHNLTFNDALTYDWEQIKNDILNTAVNNAIGEAACIDKAEKNGVVLSAEIDSQINSQVDSLISQMGESELTKKILAMGLSGIDHYKKMYKRSALLNDIQIDIAKNPAKYYSGDIKNLNKFKAQSNATVKHILIQDDVKNRNAEKFSTANSVLKKAKSSTSFESLMSKYNEDTGEPEYGYTFGPNEMVKEFEDASFALDINEISEIVETSYGYHIIKRIPGYYDLVNYFAKNSNIAVDKVSLSDISISDILATVSNAQ